MSGGPDCRGDALVPAISAASILAKTYRDAWMRSFHEIWPDYGFASHKGYATLEHLAALECHGACPLHRRSFMPVKGNDRMVVRGVPVRTRGRRGGAASYNRARPTADPSMSQFVHLRVHTEFSLLDSVVRVPELIDATVAAGMPAIALTDETNLFAMVKFYRGAQARGLKPIVGVDVRLRDAADRQEPARLTLP